MFMVINKDKVISYIISLGTVAILFIMSFVMTKNNENILQTSTNSANNNSIIENYIRTNSLSTETNSNFDNTNKVKGNNLLKNEYNTTGEN